MGLKNDNDTLWAIQTEKDAMDSYNQCIINTLNSLSLSFAATKSCQLHTLTVWCTYGIPTIHG